MLASRQLMRFASFIGFEGSAGEWEPEYQELCATNGWNSAVGIDASTFTYFVNTKDSGGHCTDDDLRRILTEVASPASAVLGPSSEHDMKPGDWACPRCESLQFARNDQCRKCGGLKPVAGAGSGGQRRGYQGTGGARARSRSPKSKTTCGPGERVVRVEKLEE